jgi:hypothetical protein
VKPISHVIVTLQNQGRSYAVLGVYLKGFRYGIGVWMKLASLFLKVALSTASYSYRTRYYSEGSSRGNGEGALLSADRTQLMTPCGSIVKAEGCIAPGH